VKNLNKEEKKFSLAQKLWGHFILTRPQQLIWLDVFGAMSFYVIVTRHIPYLHYLLFVLCAVICDAGACTLNDVGDIASDKKSLESSRNKRPLVIGSVSKKAAQIQGFSLYLIGLAIALFLDFYVFIFALTLVILSYQYSMKPLKMDAKPIISQVFWVSFGFLYYFAAVAYLRRYENVPLNNIYYGLYFLGAMIMFLAIAETLAKDLRDLENDRLGGKNTTPSYFGPRPAVAASFTFSVFGSIFWVIPYFSVYDTHIILQALVILLVVIWNGLCLILCRSIYRKYTKSKARKLHKGYILTFTMIMTLSFLGGII
jgi:4-hydroxybenzoate polyprenyltransferase